MLYEICFSMYVLPNLLIKCFIIGLILTLGFHVTGYTQNSSHDDKNIQSDSTEAPSAKKSSITLSGRIHRTITMIDDGIESNIFFMDSDQAPSSLKLVFSKNLEKNFSVYGNFEVAIQSNRAYEIDQENINTGTAIRTLASEIVFDHLKLGKLSLGTGFSSSAIQLQTDLSGTPKSSNVLIGLLAPGFFFGSKSTNQLSTIRVRDYYFAPERLLVNDRARYDSPILFNCLQLTSTLTADQRWDAGLIFTPNLKNFKAKGILTYENQPFYDAEYRFVAIGSVKSVKTGLSATSGFVHMQTTGRDRTPWGYLIKLGLERNPFSVGSSALSVDYNKGNQQFAPTESSSSVGSFFQQNIRQINLDIYIGYRMYNLVTPSDNLHQLNTYTFGIIYRFVKHQEL
jgi:hypothetical protein